MQAKLEPLKKENRIWIMDSLRGIAILGIFIANLNSFTWYNSDAQNTGPYFTSADKLMSFLHTMFIEGKFYSIFSFLFGWGIAIQLQRNTDKGIASIKLVRRRLVFMFLLGLCHLILLWFGDIVMFYALVGFVLLWIRNWSDKRLFITAIILLLSPILLYYLKMQVPLLNAPSQYLIDKSFMLAAQLNNIKSGEDFANAIHNMTIIENIKFNIGGLFYRYGDLFFQSRISKVLGMFIIGYLIGRDNKYKAIISNTRLFKRVTIVCLLVGLIANFVYAIWHDGQTYYALSEDGLHQTIIYAIGVAPLAIAYIGLVFLASKTRAGEKLLRVLQPVGKMAFSNYILHSIIGAFVFTGIGLALDRQVGPVYFTIFGIIVFILQIILSTIWLKYFEFGPVEWLWRSFTYGKRQPFLKIENKTSET